MKSLEKKIKEKKLIVIKTDKSSRFAVCSEDAYLRMGRVHTSKDRKVDRGELIETEKLLNSHCVAWGKLWRSGDHHDHRGRMINSKKTSSENTADMYILLKDHKEGEKTRPIVTGCTSNTLGMSNNTASVIEAVAASIENPFESISSEDMISKTKDYNRRVLERRREKEELRKKFRKEDHCTCKEEEEGLLEEQGADQGPLISQRVELEVNEEEKGMNITEIFDKEELLGEQGADHGPLYSQRVVEDEQELVGEQGAVNGPLISQRVVEVEEKRKEHEQAKEIEEIAIEKTLPFLTDPAKREAPGWSNAPSLPGLLPEKLRV